MKTFSELRKAIKSSTATGTHPVNYHGEPLCEESWLSKGFALGQGIRHASIKTQIDSVANQILTACDRGKRETDLDQKLTELLDAISKIGTCLKLQAELSRNTINVGIASNLLDDDIKTQVRSALGLKR